MRKRKQRLSDVLREMAEVACAEPLDPEITQRNLERFKSFKSQPWAWSPGPTKRREEESLDKEES